MGRSKRGHLKVTVRAEQPDKEVKDGTCSEIRRAVVVTHHSEIQISDDSNAMVRMILSA